MTACKQLPPNYGQVIIDNHKAKVELLMQLYPLITKTAAQKWLYLKSHGYQSYQRYEDGIRFSHKDRLHVRGCIDWHGVVSWDKEA